MTQKLIEVLADNYGLTVNDAVPLVGGLDLTATVWLVTTKDGSQFVAKVKRWREGALRYFYPVFEQVTEGIVSPVKAQNSLPWAGEGDFWVHLYPFVLGKNGIENPLTPEAVKQVGRILRKVHDVNLIPTNEILGEEFYEVDHVEEFCSLWSEGSEDPVSRILDQHREAISHLISRTAELGTTLRNENHPHVPSHADLHAGNILVTPRGSVHIIDWDGMRMAPRECDLMFFIGGGIFGHEEWFEHAFFEGYGSHDLNWELITYYRYARALEDIVLFSLDIWDEIFTDQSPKLMHYLLEQFKLGAVLDLAKRDDPGN